MCTMKGTNVAHPPETGCVRLTLSRKKKRGEKKIGKHSPDQLVLSTDGGRVLGRGGAMLHVATFSWGAAEFCTAAAAAAAPAPAPAAAAGFVPPPRGNKAQGARWGHVHVGKHSSPPHSRPPRIRKSYGLDLHNSEQQRCVVVPD